MYIHISTSKCSYFIVENQIFCFFKKWVFAFLDKGTYPGGSQVPQNFEGIVHKGGEVLTDLEIFGKT